MYKRNSILDITAEITAIFRNLIYLLLLGRISPFVSITKTFAPDNDMFKKFDSIQFFKTELAVLSA